MCKLCKGFVNEGVFILVFVAGKKVESSTAKTCTDPVSCVAGSMNSGQRKVTLNSQCCNNIDLCNSVNAPGTLIIRFQFEVLTFIYIYIYIYLEFYFNVMSTYNLYRFATKAF